MTAVIGIGRKGRFEEKRLVAAFEKSEEDKKEDEDEEGADDGDMDGGGGGDGDIVCVSLASGGFNPASTISFNFHLNSSIAT